MRTLTEQLAKYGAYHRDRRNVATHLVGVPMIVLAVQVLLSRPFIETPELTLSPALFLTAAALVFYIRLDLVFGAVMTLLLGIGVLFGAWAAQQSTQLWLCIGGGGFVAGWIIQFVGHYFEGRKPAFVDDLIGLLIGPLFVLAELFFMLGLRKKLKLDCIAAS